MARDRFTLDSLISTIKELKNLELGSQLREMLKQANASYDQDMLTELVEEIENDLDEHIARLERISSVLKPDERARPEDMDEQRRREVAFAGKCDLEDVESLCDAFSRARTLVAEVGEAEAQTLDLRRLLMNIGNMPAIDQKLAENAAGEGERRISITPQLIQQLIAASRAARAKSERPTIKHSISGLDELFDLERTATPKNRIKGR